MKKKINIKLIINIFALLVPIALIVFFCVSEDGFIDLIEDAARFNIFWLIMALACHLFNMLVDAYLSFKFTNNNFEKKYTFKKSLKATAVGQFFNLITPGTAGGPPMQIYCMSNQGVDSGVATSAMVQKFLVYQTTITIYSAFAMIFNLDLFSGSMSGLMKGLAAFGFISHAVVIIFVFIFSFNKKITLWLISFTFNLLAKVKIIKNAEEKIKKIESQLSYFHDSNIKLYQNPKLLLTTFAGTTVQLTAIFIVPYMVYRAFNLHGANVFDMIAAQSFVTMVSSFMPLPGGAGAAEGSFYVFFAIFFTAETIKPAILIWRIITYILSIIILAPFARVKKQEEKINSKEAKP